MTARPRRLARTAAPVLSGFARNIRRATRVASVLILTLGGVGLVLLGVALIYPPAALIAAGLAAFGVATFDPDRVSRLTWPR